MIETNLLTFRCNDFHRIPYLHLYNIHKIRCLWVNPSFQTSRFKSFKKSKILGMITIIVMSNKSNQQYMSTSSVSHYFRLISIQNSIKTTSAILVKITWDQLFHSQHLPLHLENNWTPTIRLSFCMNKTTLRMIRTNKR